MIDLDITRSYARLTLNRAPVNAINDEWLSTFHARIDEVERAPDLGVLHIRSAQKVFCAGMDLEQVRDLFGTSGGASAMVHSVVEFQRLFARIELLPLVVIAEIGGAALGGGLELTLACDLRAASTRAKLGLPEARLGLIPGAGGTQRLTRLCNRGVASRIILTGEIVDGATAAHLGIVQWAVEPEQLQERTQVIARQVAELSPAALCEAKKLIAAAGDPSRDGYAEEREADRRLFNTEDTKMRIDQFLAGAA